MFCRRGLDAMRHLSSRSRSFKLQPRDKHAYGFIPHICALASHACVDWPQDVSQLPEACVVIAGSFGAYAQTISTAVTLTIHAPPRFHLGFTSVSPRLHLRLHLRFHLYFLSIFVLRIKKTENPPILYFSCIFYIFLQNDRKSQVKP